MSDPAGVLRVLEAMPTAFVCFDRDWMITYANAEVSRLVGLDHEQLLGRNHWELFPEAVGQETERQYRHAVDTGEPVTFETFYPAPLNGWYEIRAFPKPEGLAVYFLNITARKAVQLRAEQTLARFELLALVSAELTGTLDPDEAVGRLAQLVVPALGDWAIVSIVDETHPRRPGGVRNAGSWHTDPTLRDTVADYAALRDQVSGPQSTVAKALAAGEMILEGDALTAAINDATEHDEQARQLLHSLDPAAAAFFPLRGRGRDGGLLTLVNGHSRVGQRPAVRPAASPVRRAAAGHRAAAASAVVARRRHSAHRGRGRPRRGCADCQRRG